jgi:5-carboxymethyl-2-hydroxymuconate isomerase
MPHLVIDYSRNLEGKAEIPALCRKLHAAILGTGLFELGAVRVRAIAADHAVIADDLPENGYLDICFRIGVGRSIEDRKRAGDMIYAVAEQHLAPLLATPHVALSFEIREIDATLSWKTNAIHPRLRGK